MVVCNCLIIFMKVFSSDLKEYGTAYGSLLCG